MIVGNEPYQGVVNIGTNPTFKDQAFAVEAFLFDYHDDLYGKELQVHFVTRIRDEATFPSPEALVRQIEQDVRAAKEILYLRSKLNELFAKHTGQPEEQVHKDMVEPFAEILAPLSAERSMPLTAAATAA